MIIFIIFRPYSMSGMHHVCLVGLAQAYMVVFASALMDVTTVSAKLYLIAGSISHTNRKFVQFQCSVY